MSAVEAPQGTVRARRGRRLLWPALAVVGAGALAMLLLADRCGSAAEVREVEALTADAQTFIKLVRSGLPAEWSIEKVLEFPALRPGSQAMTDLQHKRGQARVNLENKVDALLPEGERPDLSGMTEWIASPSWMPRARVLELAGELHRLDQQLTRLREKHGLDPAPLPLAGESLPPLPTPIALPELPDGLDFGGVQVWPLDIAVVAFQWGHDPRGCRGARPYCRYYEVTWLSWEGAEIATTTVEPPPEGHAQWMYGVSPDGAFHTVAGAAGAKGEVRIERYEPGAPEPQRALVQLDATFFDTGSTSAGFVIGLDPYSETPRYLAVRAGPELVELEEPGRSTGGSSEELDRREGSKSGLWIAGGTLEVLRREGAVFSTYTPEGAKAPESVFRLADFTSLDELYLRRMIHDVGGTVLGLEGSKSRPSLLLSRDAGRTWIGAAAE